MGVSFYMFLNFQLVSQLLNMFLGERKCASDGFMGGKQLELDFHCKSHS